MDLEGLRSFVAIAREKSISKAALSLHVTQPTLSARVRKLEEGLGVRLMDRSWDGVKLTLQGHYFLRYAIQLLQVFSDATEGLHAHNNLGYKHVEEATNLRRLTIGIDTFLTPSFIRPLIHELRCHYPELECKITSISSTFLLDFIENGAVHVGVLFLQDERPGIQTIPLINDELLLLYPNTYETEIDAELNGRFSLKDKPFLLFDNPVLVNSRNVTKEIFLRLFGEVPERFHIVDNLDVTLEIIAKGYGYTVIASASVAHLMEKYPTIRVVRLGDRFPKPSIHIAHSEFHHAPIPLQPLLDKLAFEFRNMMLVSQV